MLPQNLLYTLGIMGFLNGFLALISVSLALVHYSSVVVGSSMLLQVVFAQLYGVLLGLDKIPGILTFVGFGVCALGTMVMKRKKVHIL